jgi:CubicO group peptidase (beta-lactamase class C family)
MSGGGASLEAEIEALFARPPDEGVSLALVVQQHGELVAERYGMRPPNLFEPEPAPVTAATPLVSWSVAKSITHAAIGILVGDGLLDPADPAPVPEWEGTEKEAITTLDLLEMRSGLAFVEDYVDGEASDVIDMLFGSGASDHAAYAAAKPLVHPVGTFWSYSSGTTNILSRIIGDIVAGGSGGAPGEREAAMREFLDQRLFGRIGMPDADPRFDEAGNWVGSSYVHAPARQFARFGELYLRDGVAGDERVVPEGWVDHARAPVAHDPENGCDYGRHWWLWPDQPGSLAAHGYEGQYVLVLPERDAVVVHLGKTDASVRDRLVARIRRIVATLPD